MQENDFFHPFVKFNMSSETSTHGPVRTTRRTVYNKSLRKFHWRCRNSIPTGSPLNKYTISKWFLIKIVICFGVDVDRSRRKEVHLWCYWDRERVEEQGNPGEGQGEDCDWVSWLYQEERRTGYHNGLNKFSSKLWRERQRRSKNRHSWSCRRNPP